MKEKTKEKDSKKVMWGESLRHLAEGQRLEGENKSIARLRRKAALKFELWVRGRGKPRRRVEERLIGMGVGLGLGLGLGLELELGLRLGLGVELGLGLVLGGERVEARSRKDGGRRDGVLLGLGLGVERGVCVVEVELGVVLVRCTSSAGTTKK
ncbi:hypothetical protein E2C01_075931 [Portunus trituberculatus]|uniref:Uncharacterized protein n=1 Tax=Portunus trituberculatus TaxID=210409 RepID=A0A5B7ILV8_PORTR|nr:hypothetical protein [Portunus trituberculatus]